MEVITVKIRDDVEKLLREMAYRKFGNAKGSLSKALEEAIIYWASSFSESLLDELTVEVTSPDILSEVLKEIREEEGRRLSKGVTNDEGGD